MLRLKDEFNNQEKDNRLDEDNFESLLADFKEGDNIDKLRVMKRLSEYLDNHEVFQIYEEALDHTFFKIRAEAMIGLLEKEKIEILQKCRMVSFFENNINLIDLERILPLQESSNSEVRKTAKSILYIIEREEIISDIYSAEKMSEIINKFEELDYLTQSKFITSLGDNYNYKFLRFLIHNLTNLTLSLRETTVSSLRKFNHKLAVSKTKKDEFLAIIQRISRTKNEDLIQFYRGQEDEDIQKYILERFRQDRLVNEYIDFFLDVINQNKSPNVTRVALFILLSNMNEEIFDKFLSREEIIMNKFVIKTFIEFIFSPSEGGLKVVYFMAAFKLFIKILKLQRKDNLETILDSIQSKLNYNLFDLSTIFYLVHYTSYHGYTYGEMVNDFEDFNKILPELNLDLILLVLKAKIDYNMGLQVDEYTDIHSACMQYRLSKGKESMDLLFKDLKNSFIFLNNFFKTRDTSKQNLIETDLLLKEFILPIYTELVYKLVSELADQGLTKEEFSVFVRNYEIQEDLAINRLYGDAYDNRIKLKQSELHRL